MTQLPEVATALSEVTELAERPERLSSNNEATIHFTLKGGLILLEAGLESTMDSFLLDTGAPSLFLNSSEIQKNENSVQAIGITGDLLLEELIIPELRMNNLVQEDIAGYKIDIQHLEKIKRCRMGGIIGQDLIKNHEVFIDYKNQVLKLLDPKSVELEEKMHLVEKIPFKMEGHFAVMKLKIGKKEYSFGIDTGSEANVLDRKLKRKLKRYYKRKGTVGVNGLDKNRSSSIEVAINQLFMGQQEIEKMPFLISNLSAINAVYDASLDGLLGFPFLKQFPFSINYEDQHLYIWEYGQSQSEKEAFLMMNGE